MKRLFVLLSLSTIGITQSLASSPSLADVVLKDRVSRKLIQLSEPADIESLRQALYEPAYEKRDPIKVFPSSYLYEPEYCVLPWRRIFLERTAIIRSAKKKIADDVPAEEVSLFIWKSEFRLIVDQELSDMRQTWYFGSLARSHKSNAAVLFYLNRVIPKSYKPIFVNKFIESRQPGPGYLLTLYKSDRSLIKDCLADETLMACRAEYASLLLQALYDERNMFELLCNGQRRQYELRANIHNFCPAEGLAAMEKARRERLKKFDISELCEQLDFMLSHLKEETFPDSNLVSLLCSSIKIFYKLGKHDEVVKYGASYTTLPQFGATLSQNVLDIIEECKNL